MDTSNPATAVEHPGTASLVPPSSQDPPGHQRPAGPDAERRGSQGSISSTRSSRSHQEYLDSLTVPSKEQIARIAEKQAEREAEHKRAHRHKQHQSIDAVLAPATPATPAEPQPEQSHHIPLASRFGFNFGRRPSLSDDGLRIHAATVIQRTYRGYRARREIKGLGINASTRWVHAIREAQWRELTTPHARSDLVGDGSEGPERPAAGRRSSTARQNWKKVSAIARHAGG
ncbi:uncharacterized protein P884DRAFT_184607, partial [Thermothelomyces heterothallicus CBS 202.75]|uniref:uncharacterized protein n=1 Tax=Thermothelomyces heterothallicus CBS 202.75 TaxID=1149848 RepID=UPI003743990C